MKINVPSFITIENDICIICNTKVTPTTIQVQSVVGSKPCTCSTCENWNDCGRIDYVYENVSAQEYKCNTCFNNINFLCKRCNVKSLDNDIYCKKCILFLDDLKKANIILTTKLTMKELKPLLNKVNNHTFIYNTRTTKSKLYKNYTDLYNKNKIFLND